MFFGAWSREGAVRPHAAGVRFKIRIIILTGKTLCIFRSTRMVNFRQKNPFGSQNFFLPTRKRPEPGAVTFTRLCKLSIRYYALFRLLIASADQKVYG
jgi:hypothetical protein